MKKLFASILSFGFSLAGLYAADIVVGPGGGNWSEPSTWVGGVPPVSGTDFVLFNNESGVLNVNESMSFAGIMKFGGDDGAGCNAYINIESGATLTLSASWQQFNYYNENTTDWHNNKIFFQGEGNMELSGGAVLFHYGLYDIGVSTKFSGVQLKQAEINVSVEDSDGFNIDGTETTDGNFSFRSNPDTADFRMYNDSSFRISSGASALVGPVFSCGTNMNITVEDGGFLFSEHGLALRNILGDASSDTSTLTVKGAVQIEGSTVTGDSFDNANKDKTRAGLYVANLVVEETGNLIIKYDTHDVYIAKSMKCNGSVFVQQNRKFCFMDGSALTLGSGSRILAQNKDGGIASDQADSYLYLVSREVAGTESDGSDKDIAGRRTHIDETLNNAAHVTLNLESDQKLGGFYFAAGSSLTIHLGGNKLGLKSFEMMEGADGSPSIKIDDFADGLFGLYGNAHESFNFDWLEAYKDGNRLTAENTEWKKGEGDFSDYYFLYSSAVPEASTVSAILGIFALAFAAWRRRK